MGVYSLQINRKPRKWHNFGFHRFVSYHFSGIETGKLRAGLRRLWGPAVRIFLRLLTKYSAEVKLPQIPTSGFHPRLRLDARQRGQLAQRKVRHTEVGEEPAVGKGSPGQPRSVDRRRNWPMGVLEAGLVVLGGRDFPRGGR